MGIIVFASVHSIFHLSYLLTFSMRCCWKPDKKQLRGPSEFLPPPATSAQPPLIITQIIKLNTCVDLALIEGWTGLTPGDGFLLHRQPMNYWCILQSIYYQMHPINHIRAAQHWHTNIRSLQSCQYQPDMWVYNPCNEPIWFILARLEAVKSCRLFWLMAVCPLLKP